MPKKGERKEARKDGRPGGRERRRKGRGDRKHLNDRGMLKMGHHSSTRHCSRKTLWIIDK